MVAKEKDEKADVYAWLGMLGPPVVWIVNFEIIYAGVLAACANKSKTALLLSCLVSLALIAGCAVLSRRELTAEPKHEARRFMARVGLMSATIFALITIAQLIGIVVMDPCLT
jgi:uncharacterized membrane protein